MRPIWRKIAARLRAAASARAAGRGAESCATPSPGVTVHTSGQPTGRKGYSGGKLPEEPSSSGLSVRAVHRVFWREIRDSTRSTNSLSADSAAE